MTDHAPRGPGRRPHTLLGLTAVQWAQALGPVTPASLRKAQRVISGRTEPPLADLVTIARVYELDLSTLVEGVLSAVSNRPVG